MEAIFPNFFEDNECVKCGMFIVGGNFFCTCCESLMRTMCNNCGILSTYVTPNGRMCPQCKLYNCVNPSIICVSSTTNGGYCDYCANLICESPS